MLFKLDEESIENEVTRIKGLTPTKVRQYFDDVKGLKRKVEAGLTEKQIKIQLQLILSRAIYDTGRAIERKNKEEEEGFKNIRANIERALKAENQDITQSVKELATFFETIYGRFYYEKKKEGGDKEDE
ncbi:MAG TPA: type III-A CRISPR-associated protein Csm2 [Geobacterales bacterium]|nr:type III-A CRISPR-associated protein Csm2 [Geobacterales bacterium]